MTDTTSLKLADLVNAWLYGTNRLSAHMALNPGNDRKAYEDTYTDISNTYPQVFERFRIILLEYLTKSRFSMNDGIKNLIKIERTDLSALFPVLSFTYY